MNRTLFSFMDKEDVEYKGRVPIRDISYVRIGGIADAVAYPDTEEKLIRLLEFLTSTCVKYKIIGKMSNLLPPDEDYHGILVATDRLCSYSQDKDVVYCECGVPLTLLIARMARHGLGGLESLFGIPASIGGAVYQNAGAFGIEISDVFTECRAFDVNRKKTVILTREQMRFSYRKSILQDGGLVLLSATLRFAERDSEDIIRDIRLVTQKRRSTQPICEYSLGSTFKSQKGVSAARLIDGAGLKGVQVGGAVVSNKHAGFIINTGDATAEDYLTLMRLVIDEVRSKYGVTLVPEIESFT